MKGALKPDAGSIGFMDFKDLVEWGFHDEGPGFGRTKKLSRGSAAVRCFRLTLHVDFENPCVCRGKHSSREQGGQGVSFRCFRECFMSKLETRDSWMFPWQTAISQCVYIKVLVIQ